MTIALSGCMKDYLEEKRDKSQVIPVSLKDYHMILEHNKMNNMYPVLGEVGSDDYYISKTQWDGLSDPVQKNAYVWADEVFEESRSIDWNNGFEKILLTNFVIEGVRDMEYSARDAGFHHTVLGSGYFLRALSYFKLAQLFCKQYDVGTADKDLGMPLRTSPNINKYFSRATLSATYRFILDDLLEANRLLPIKSELNTRPSKAAALGALAMVYHQMEVYEKAEAYADSALMVYATLIDYNKVDVDLASPFPLYGQGNPEIVFYSSMGYMAILANARLTVDSTLYGMYENTDLRKSAYFTTNGGRVVPKPLYFGQSDGFFCGITTAELLLIRAESRLRIGNREGAIGDLNRLHAHRYVTGNVPKIASDISYGALLEKTLVERRKELVFRGRRWSELRRLNKNKETMTSIRRKLGDEEYELPVGSAKWTWPIPSNVITLGGYQQNER